MMNSIRSPKAFYLFTPLALLLGLAGCSSSSLPMAPHVGRLQTSSHSGPTTPSTASSAAPTTTQASTNGAAGQMPAYYDRKLFTVNMKQQPDGASAATIAQNGSVNAIFASNDLDDEQDFVPVINAIQGDGFNPLWQQFLIVFNPGFTAHQFFSDDEVKTAAAGEHPEITLVETDEVYRCSVVGSK
jgi:hypothetical protein